MFTSAVKNSQYGRGQGSFRVSEGGRGITPQKKAIGSFRGIKKDVDFDPKDYIVTECSLRDVEVFKQVFDFLDDDHDGMLTPMDLRKAIREYGGYKPSKSFVYVAMSNFDADDGGEITFKEFVKLMTQKPYENDTTEDIQRVFENLDEDNKGFISREDLLAAADQLKQEITPAEVEEMIRECDPDGEGVIRLQAFIEFNRRKQF